VVHLSKRSFGIVADALIAGVAACCRMIDVRTGEGSPPSLARDSFLHSRCDSKTDESIASAPACVNGFHSSRGGLRGFFQETGNNLSPWRTTVLAPLGCLGEIETEAAFDCRGSRR